MEIIINRLNFENLIKLKEREKLYWNMKKIIENSFNPLSQIFQNYLPKKFFIFIFIIYIYYSYYFYFICYRYIFFCFYYSILFYFCGSFIFY